jgi:hypothetical protein
MAESEGGKLYELMQMARSRLRYHAHRYVHAKRKDKHHSDAAAEEMEQAAIAFALAASAYGAKSDCARPAGPEGNAWKASMDPEELLKTEELRYTAEIVSKDPSFKKHVNKIQRTGGRGR